MVREVVKDAALGDLLPHYFERGGLTKPDRFGKLEGYRVSPPGQGNNKTATGVYYRSMDDVADHLLANPGWGVRVSKPGSPASLRNDNVYVDGKKIS
jgi:hypothetical protein